MKAIINLRYSTRIPSSIRYFADKKKVVKAIDGLNTGVMTGRADEDAELLLSEHHDPTSCKAARAFVLSIQTPKNATAEQLKMIDDGLEEAFFDFKKHVGGLPMLGWIHGNTATRHLHGLFPNSDGRRGLDLGPKWLSTLQDFFGQRPSPQVVAKAAKHSPYIQNPASWQSGILQICCSIQVAASTKNGGQP